MSDVTAPPPSPAPSAPALTPAQHEVPINQAPIGSQNPVTNTPPEKPAEDRNTSRKAALQRAFDRANDPEGSKAREAAKPAPRAAEARPGHNQPPEETPQEKLDLKKRPGDIPRGERGQFASRTNQQPENQPKEGGYTQNGTNQQPGQPDQAPYKRLPPHAPYAEPPARMADHAKADWHATPERVRGEIYRMHNEFQNAYAQYRGAAEAFEPIAGYHQMAQEHGTTLDRALHNYVTMEQKLRQDVLGGLDIIINNLNLRTADGEKINLRDIAYHVLNQSPESHQLVQQQNAQQAAAAQIGSLHQEVEGLKNHLQQVYAEQQFNYLRGGVDHYATSHPRFDELGDLIKHEIDLGFDLDTAYRRAELLRPATHAAQTGNPSAQTRPTDKSIYGAPDVTPSNGASRRNGKPVGRREAIQNAIRRAGGAL